MNENEKRSPADRLKKLETARVATALANIQKVYATYQQHIINSNDDNISEDSSIPDSYSDTNSYDGVSDSNATIAQALSTLHEHIQPAYSSVAINPQQNHLKNIDNDIQILKGFITTLAQKKNIDEKIIQTITAGLDEINKIAETFKKDEIHQIVNSVNQYPEIYKKTFLDPDFTHAYNNTPIHYHFPTLRHNFTNQINSENKRVINTDKPEFIQLRKIFSKHLSKEDIHANHANLYNELTEIKKALPEFFEQTFKPFLTVMSRKHDMLDEINKSVKQQLPEQHNLPFFNIYNKKKVRTEEVAKKLSLELDYVYNGIALINKSGINNNALGTIKYDLAQALSNDSIDNGVEFLDVLKGKRLAEGDYQKSLVLNGLIETSENTLLQRMATEQKMDLNLLGTPKGRNEQLARLELNHILPHLKQDPSYLQETITQAKQELAELKQTTILTKENPLASNKRPTTGFVEMDIAAANNNQATKPPKHSDANFYTEHKIIDLNNENIRSAVNKDILLLNAKISLLEQMQATNDLRPNQPKNP